MTESRAKRDIVAECLHDRHTSADAILNALHQEGWMIVPRPSPADIAEMERRLLEAMDEDEAMSALQILRPWLCRVTDHA